MFHAYSFGPQGGWLGFIEMADGSIIFVPVDDGAVYVHDPDAS